MTGSVSYGSRRSVILRSFASNGKLIGETNWNFSRPLEVHFRISGPGLPVEGDFIDNVKKAGSGDYVLTATFDNGDTYRKEITVISSATVTLRRFPRPKFAGFDANSEN